jgi:hypothetical protein
MLQGLAFWTGYSRTRFRGYPLGESAFVAEAGRLVHANLGEGVELRMEVQYRQLLLPDASPTRAVGRKRADLVIVKKQVPSTKSPPPAKDVLAVLEVKRASAPATEITADLERLFDWVVAVRSPARAFLLVASEGKEPQRFVKNGVAIAGNHNLPNTDGAYRVRRVCKASRSFEHTRSAHYAVLVEVLARRQATRAVRTMVKR